MNNSQPVSASSQFPLITPNREMQDLGKTLQDFWSFWTKIPLILGDEEGIVNNTTLGENLKPELSAMLQGQTRAYPNIGAALIEFMNLFGDEFTPELDPSKVAFSFCFSRLLTEQFMLRREYLNPSSNFFQTLTQNQIREIEQFFKINIKLNLLSVIDMIYYSSTPNQTDAGETCSQTAGGRNSYQEGCLTRIPNFGPAEIGAIFSYILSSENLLLMKAFDEIAGEYEIEWESDQNVTARLRNGGVRSPLINTLLLQLYRQVRDENRAQLQQRVQ